MHRDTIIRHLVRNSGLVLERPDVTLEDYVFACKHMSELFTRWSVEASTSAALAKMREERGKRPSGLVKAVREEVPPPGEDWRSK